MVIFQMEQERILRIGKLKTESERVVLSSNDNDFE